MEDSPSQSQTLQQRRGEASGSQDESVEVYYAVSDYTAVDDTQLSLREGDEITVLEKMSDSWWWAEMSNSTGYVPTNHLSETNPLERVDKWQDDEYYSSYGTLKLHLEMLSDRPRTLAYRTAIERARGFIQDKVVLDLGCGTGILSLFCAQLGGARKVYGVEASEMSEHTREVVKHNGLGGQVEVIQGRAEEVQLPEKVDLIISEWMGTLLLFELMLESVLITRDKWLKDGGVMWPSEAELFLVPCSAQECYDKNVAFWNDVYGFDFSPLIPLAQSEMLGRPIYNHVLSEEDCLSPPCSIMRLHLKTTAVGDIECTVSSFKCTITKKGTLHGFGSWFDVTFGGIPEGCGYEPVTLSTSPQHLLTHWKQDLLMVDIPLPVEPGDRVDGNITITRNRLWRRHLRVLLQYAHTREDHTTQEFQKEYALWR